MDMPVLYLKLSSGEEVISFVEETEDSFILYTPLQIHSMNTPRGTSVQFSHWAQFTEDDVFEIRKSHIVLDAIPKQDILEYYSEVINSPKATQYYNEEVRTVH
jgi:hypothetical protein